jgi:hypothetical protein
MHQDSPVSDYPLKTRSFCSGGFNYRVSRRPLHKHQATTHGRGCPGHPLARCADWFMLAFGFETFAFWKKTELSRLDGFSGQPDTGSNAIFGIILHLGQIYWQLLI